MCMECGCGEHSGSTHLEFTANGYSDESAKTVEKELLGLPGVLHVHIHAHNGETFIDYNPAKTRLTEILGVFERYGVNAAI